MKNKKTLVGLPVDGRPVVRRQVQDLVAAAGWEMRMPEVAALGHMREPAPREALAAWLEREAADAAGVVVSIDMLVYGGLVPSRFIADELHALLPRLALFRRLKQRQPRLPIYAFAATMRISNNNVAEEEKPYWAEHGERLWAWSFHSDRHGQTGDAEAARLAAAAEAAIPAEIRNDYLATRARNFAVNEALLDLVAEGVIARLILPQDDTAEYGFNIAERRRLQQLVQERGLASRVLIYPGADEVMHTLAAHLVGRAREDAAPLRIALSCSDPHHLQQLRARYEDRPVLDSLASQLEAVGARLVANNEPADLLLALHSSGPAQGDWAMRLPLPAPQPLDTAWVEQLASTTLPLAVVDLAYANGADPVLIEALAARGLLPKLVGYAGWNTASNSLGSLLAQLVLAREALGDEANRLNTALRLAEDYLYQARLRRALRERIDEPALSADELAAEVRSNFVPAADAWLRETGLPGRIARCYLPWDRTFEIGLELQC
ncbi:DUF4127 family protein [Roseateles violae]|uniref:DUF4127 family protein n=1 Tax=Roseateles violae TaxID=3058042 RepID=A0ABT8DQ94_9BURK|nr:DUF4127 family protein [Pelomonas sp. PFR6]MDN3920332.1 DUF4127 family protein [Pelomonas sp. PFR6]